MKTLGADIIRLWVCSADYRGEMSVSDEILNRMSDSYRRIRNTIRFLLANTNGFDPTTDLIAIKDMLALVTRSINGYITFVQQNWAVFISIS